MDFTLTEEQTALANTVNRFIERTYDFQVRSGLLKTTPGYGTANWQEFAELGWLGAGLSENDGGFGGGAVENMLIMEQFGRALVVEPFVPNAILTLQTLVALPRNDAIEALIERIVSGQTKAVLAHGEAASRGSEDGITCQLEKSEITGKKTLVFGAPSADKLLVSAKTKAGVGLYLVDPAAAGLTAHPYRLLDNSRAADITLASTQFEQEIARPGTAAPAIAAGYAHTRCALCAEAVGAMDKALTMTRDFLKTRQQFGATLNSFQALQHRMADMLVETELARSAVYQAIAMLGGPAQDRDRAVSIMKAVTSSAAMFVGRNAIQLHGAIGMTEEYAIGHYYRRLFVIASIFGNEAFHLKRIADNPQPFWKT